MERLTDKCKNCNLTREDHQGFWKVTKCKFEKEDTSQGETEQ